MSKNSFLSIMRRSVVVLGLLAAVHFPLADATCHTAIQAEYGSSDCTGRPDGAPCAFFSTPDPKCIDGARCGCSKSHCIREVCASPTEAKCLMVDHPCNYPCICSTVPKNPDHVTCGNHLSDTGCAGCPRDKGASYCNGDSEWVQASETCVKKEGLCKNKMLCLSVSGASGGTQLLPCVGKDE